MTNVSPLLLSCSHFTFEDRKNWDFFSFLCLVWFDIILVPACIIISSRICAFLLQRDSMHYPVVLMPPRWMVCNTDIYNDCLYILDTAEELTLVDAYFIPQGCLSGYILFNWFFLLYRQISRQLTCQQPGNYLMSPDVLKAVSIPHLWRAVSSLVCTWARVLGYVREQWTYPVL